MQSLHREAHKAAAERAVSALRRTAPSQVRYMDHDSEHDLRQEFRRRIDREIIATNNPSVAIRSLETVLKVAQNILANPEEPKYRRLGFNKDAVKKNITDPNLKGVLQLVIDLGFRIKAEDFESFLVYNDQTYIRLRVGSMIIEEVLERERRKKADEDDRLRREAEAVKAHKAKLHAQFMDDRRAVHARVQRERRLPQEKGLPPRSRPGVKRIGTIGGLSDTQTQK